MWSTIDDRTICRFTSDAKDKPVSKCINLQKIKLENKTRGHFYTWLLDDTSALRWTPKV